MIVKSIVIRLAWIIMVTALLWGCSEEEQTGPNGFYDQTDDPAIYLNTDLDDLSQKLTSSNTALEINSSAYGSRHDVLEMDRPIHKRNKGNAVGDVALSMIAETKASQASGNTLQATDVAIKSNKAYVSFNQAGDVYAGAIQVVDIKKEDSPKILAELLFDDIDVNSVYIKHSTLYAVGAADSATRTLDSPAVLLIIPLKSGTPKNNISVIDLPSYAGTDVLVKKKYIYATVGASNGGLVRIRLNDPTSFDASNDFNSLEDARSLAVQSNVLGVLKGTDGKIVFFNIDDTNSTSTSLSSLAPTREIDFPNTATIANSKSTVDLVGNISIAALGDGGTKAVITAGNDDTEIISIAAVDGTSSLAATKTVTNAVTISFDLLFRANGEAGVDMFRLSKSVKSINSGDSITVTRLGSISFNSLASANGLYYRQRWLFIADGLGGMKIVGVDRNYSLTSDEDDDDSQEDQDDEDDSD